MAMPAEEYGYEAQGGVRVIDARDWPQMRFGWLEGVRRDTAINPMARLVAHVLALDFANHETLRCDPSMSQIAAVVGASPDTVKRAVVALQEAGWIARRPGRGRGHPADYAFLTRAVVVHLKGGKYAPTLGGKYAPQSAPKTEAERGAYLHGKGGKSASRYYIAKPYKNHGARETSNAAPQNGVSETVARWAEMIRHGDGSRAGYLTEIDIHNLLRLELVTHDQLRRVGIDVEQG